ncbi:MAG: ATP-binding protein [Planctomycetes bacterium]|jgi:predicted AAA+ superfamily ATPase|nr:ATP-binding protein [Planctomycetota bacterium]
MELILRLFKAPKESFFLFGPRGTGKSTWLRETFPDAIYVDLLDQEAFRTFLARPERLGEVIAGSPKAKTVIVDEIQKVPGLLDEVHRLMETQGTRELQFILTGSSARKLERGGTDLLAGRAVLKNLHPFLAAELGKRFDFARGLEIGMLPLVLDSAEPAQTLKSYAALYLREEVQAEGLVRNVGNFARFLEAMSLSHASLLNTSEVARECQVNRKTVEGFIEVLEDLLLGFRLQVFSKRAQRQLVQHPKFYYVDTGVFRSLRPKGPLDSPEEIGGACMEGLVAQHLRAWIAYSNGDRSLHFWRTKAGLEVDFVVYGQDTFLAIEVKRSRTVSSKDVRPLLAFREDYPQAKACLLYGGKERLKINGVLCVPCEEFLRNLVPDAPAPME